MTPTPSDDLVELHDDWLRVRFPAGSHADFHHRWLRHNCDCDRHPTTGERTLCSSELPDDLRPREAAVRGDALVLTWPDGHVTTYPLAWLRAHAYALGREAPPPPVHEPAALELHARGRELAELVAAALARVREHGAAVVRADPDATTDPADGTEPLIAAAMALGLRTIPTHFGRIEDLRTDNTTNQNTDQLGYTDAPVHLHTDQPFLERPPRYQLLQCIRPAAEGGDNLIADARAAFRVLASEDARAAELLTRVPVRFHRKQRSFESIVDAPIVARAGDDDFLVRSSYFTLAPHALPFAATAEFYRAHDRFIRGLRDPRNHVRVRLGPGDWLLYDNHRTLHARTGFRGARWLRGVYFDPAP